MDVREEEVVKLDAEYERVQAGEPDRLTQSAICGDRREPEGS